MALLLKNLLFTVLIPGSVALYVPLWLTWGRPAPTGGALIAAVSLFLAGTIAYGWTVWDFATHGRGTPAPVDAPKQLVARGLYRYSRNPMYVGILTVLAGHVVLFRSFPLIVYTLAVAAGFHGWIVFYEEPHLTSRFGAPYRDYCRNVGRWILRPR